MDPLPLYIGGRFVNGAEPTQTIVNPATGATIARAARATPAETEAAIQAAREAFDDGPWPAATAARRGRVLLEIARRLRESADRLARLETENMGKPIIESEFDVADAATCFEYYGGLATKVTGDVNPVPDEALSLTLKEPVGVCGQIIPWNYPLLMAAWKIAPALCAGCTLVLKPAEATPLTAIELARILDGIEDLPKGVVNILTGDGPDAGAALASSERVDKVAFTGSTRTGRTILRAAAESNLKRVTLELGGKSPNIFYADAAWEPAIEGALFGVFVNQGEVCSAGSRILVERRIHDRFLDAIVEKARTIRLGDPLDRATRMGPLVTAAHRERVAGYIEQGRREGARLVLGGVRPDRELAAGAYLEPTIFAGVDPGMTIAREEIFGPVVTVMPFEGEADALRIANATPYGLAGAVWTRDIYRAFRVVRKLRAGIVWVNHMQPTYVEAPWGGMKMSGAGRELGRYGVENYLELKQVHVNLNEAPTGWYA
ncbi:MAG: aldehyde dehydrogenase family protein [Candidatus Eisenbacteria bacterium]|uniref:Aldehyde dehydrogenase family protein n=1 Tax=Eiseniibacteriota bacterium TaxID=2212470 RepID=A0A538SYT6_UNCEI|nr:MAG: aldehyde dehydrogenase family protein [Candidatus Eisenbacteria bacterium]